MKFCAKFDAMESINMTVIHKHNIMLWMQLFGQPLCCKVYFKVHCKLFDANFKTLSGHNACLMFMLTSLWIFLIANTCTNFYANINVKFHETFMWTLCFRMEPNRIFHASPTFVTKKEWLCLWAVFHDDLYPHQDWIRGWVGSTLPPTKHIGLNGYLAGQLA